MVFNTIVNFYLRLCKEYLSRNLFQVENFLILSFSLSGRGVPFSIQKRTNDQRRISDTNLPLAREAKKLYEQTYNGQLLMNHSLVLIP